MTKKSLTTNLPELFTNSVDTVTLGTLRSSSKGLI